MSKEMLHTNLTCEDVGGYAILPGSPQRVKRIAEYLESPRFVKVNREHETYEGYLEGERVLVTSTGMGGPSTAICLEELVRLGAHTFIRIGSCATVCENVGRGDVVIPQAAVRMEGTSLHYAPIEYPAVPDMEVFDALRDAAGSLTYPTHIGTVISRDGFYTQTEAALKPVGYELTGKWNAYKMMGAITTEMECAALFIAGASLSVRTGGVLVCATSVRPDEENKTYPISFEPRAIEVGVEAMRRLILADRAKKNR